MSRASQNGQMTLPALSEDETAPGHASCRCGSVSSIKAWATRGMPFHACESRLALIDDLPPDETTFLITACWKSAY